MREVPNWKAVGLAELLAWEDGVHADGARHGFELCESKDLSLPAFEM